jgi:hypothetical protein
MLSAKMYIQLEYLAAIRVGHTHGLSDHGRLRQWARCICNSRNARMIGDRIVSARMIASTDCQCGSDVERSCE